MRVPRLPPRKARDRSEDAFAVVLSPHLDDAVLDTWSVITRPRQVTVVNVFAGIPPRTCLTEWDKLCGATDSVEWARRRIREDAKALGLAGRVPVNLPLVQRSACLAAGEPPPSLEAVAEVLVACVPQEAAVYAPAAIGGHADHVLVRDFALTLARRGFHVRLYADLPYALRGGGWPTWVAGTSGVADASEYWRQFLVGVAGPLEEARVTALTPAEARAKRRTAETYESQFRHLDEHGILSAENLTYEVFWEVRV